MNFRQDINGLRAWAVVAVILFHFHVPGFSGGFVGVDIFFVISGYLMTTILLRQQESGGISLLRFYRDRCLRIIPALALLCVTLLLMGWLTMPASTYATLGKHAAASMAFVSNHTYLGESGYFESLARAEHWLPHTWSLSVEWQFYLLYPLLLLALFPLSPAKQLRYVLLTLALASFIYALWLSQLAAEQAFYLLPARLWELLAGALVCLFPWRSAAAQGRWLEYTGFALILLSIGTASSSHWPGWQASLPVLGTCLVLYSARQGSWLSTNALAQWLGTLSYSLYLWHWPVAQGMRYFGLFHMSPLGVAGLFASILLIAYLSWRLVEQPLQSIRFKNHFSSQRLIAMALAVCVLASVWGWHVFQSQGMPQRSMEVRQQQSDFVDKYALMHQELDAVYHFECDFYDDKSKQKKQDIDPGCTEGNGKPVIFLWGDSHAQALSHGLRTIYGERYFIAQVATSQCTPSLDRQIFAPSVDNNCDYSNQYALKAIARLKPAYVVLAQSQHHELTNWKALANRLRTLGAAQVILVGPVPQWYPSLPSVIVDRHWNQPDDAFEDERQVPEVFHTNELLKQQYGGSEHLQYVSLIDALCKKRKCLAWVPGEDHELMAMDYGHLTPKGSVHAVRTALAPVIAD